MFAWSWTKNIYFFLFIFFIGLNKASLNYKFLRNLIKCQVWEYPPSLGSFSLSLIGWQTESKLYYNPCTQTPHHHSPATELFVSFGVLGAGYAYISVGMETATSYLK